MSDLSNALPRNWTKTETKLFLIMIIINYEFRCDIFLVRCAQKIDKSQGIYFDKRTANEASGKDESEQRH